MTGPRALPRGLEPTEREFQDQVIDLAHIRRWTVAHFRPALTTRGWRTPVQADGQGWPDLFMVRAGRAVAAELKRNAPTPRARARQIEPAQQMWLDLLGACPAIEVFVWRPHDWPEIEGELR